MMDTWGHRLKTNIVLLEGLNKKHTSKHHFAPHCEIDVALLGSLLHKLDHKLVWFSNDWCSIHTDQLISRPQAAVSISSSQWYNVPNINLWSNQMMDEALPSWLLLYWWSSHSPKQFNLCTHVGIHAKKHIWGTHYIQVTVAKVIVFGWVPVASLGSTLSHSPLPK